MFDLALLVMALQIPVYQIISGRFSRKTYFYKLFIQIEALPELKQLSLIKKNKTKKTVFRG